MIVMDKEFKTDEIDESMVGGTSVADPELYAMLKDLRKHLARKLGIPAYVIFQDPSLDQMAMMYPITEEELQNIQGLIYKGNDNTFKIIQDIDRKLPLDDIAVAEGLSFDELLSKIEEIVYSGTKLNIDYFLRDIYDEDKIEDIYDYFMNSHTDNIDEALKELDDDYTEDDIRLIRIKFISEMAN